MNASPTARRQLRSGIVLALVLIALALGLAACGPESDRYRGGGPGGDVGNTGNTVQLHGDQPGNERIYYQTPNEPRNAQ